MLTSLQKRQRSLNQSGINMVDLMMWLVIAALLLAAALQSIEFYKRSALIYQLSSDVMGAGQNISAAASQKGAVNPAIAQEGLAATKVSDTDTVIGQSVAPSGHFIVISSNPELPGYDVVYSSEEKDGLKTGVNVVPKGGAGYSGIMLPERGTPIDNKCGPGQWKAEYFNNVDHTGTPVATLCESKVSYNWYLNGPGVDGIGSDRFSIRWTTSFTAPETKLYNFQVSGDDGSRVKMDGTVIAGTYSISSESYSKQVQVNKGTHDLVLEWRENTGGAAVNFVYAPVP